MIVFKFWRSSVVHLCVNVCARADKEERKKFKNDEVAFENHSPGVHLSNVVFYVVCASLRPTHELDFSFVFFLFTQNLKPVSYVRGDMNSKKRTALGEPLFCFSQIRKPHTRD